MKCETDQILFYNAKFKINIEFLLCKGNTSIHEIKLIFKNNFFILIVG